MCDYYNGVKLELQKKNINCCKRRIITQSASVRFECLKQIKRARDRLLSMPDNPTSYLISAARAPFSSSSSSSSRNSLFDPRIHQTISSRAHSTATVFGVKSAFKRYHSSKNREKLIKSYYFSGRLSKATARERARLPSTTTTIYPSTQPHNILNLLPLPTTFYLQ